MLEVFIELLEHINAIKYMDAFSHTTKDIFKTLNMSLTLRIVAVKVF